jgi:catechol 2,3-dioxygenase-like lactoylglutathione lyase family enzyme
MQEAAMRTTKAPSNDAASDASVGKVDMKLEVVAIPVSDVDRAKEFYGGLGWRLDADFSKGGGRVVQFTPPGSECSVHFGTNIEHHVRRAWIRPELVADRLGHPGCA